MMRARNIVFLDWQTMSYRENELLPKHFMRLADMVDVFQMTTPEETIAHIGNADVVICNKVPITREIFNACPGIRYIGLLATGCNNVDLEAADEHGIPVCNAPDYSTDAVAQLVFSYILDHYMRVSLYHMDVRLGKWETSPTFSYFPYPTGELRGKTLSIIGYGNIGRRVAEIGRCFGMHIVISTRTTPADCPDPVVSVEEAFSCADVLTLHCPLNEQTKGLVCKENLMRMRQDAVLINTSRGGVVVEQDLADALQSGRLSAAYLDVLETEPMSGSTPLKGAKNCVITPHIGWTPFETRSRLLTIAEDNLLSWLSGTPRNVVNHPLKGRE